jgi:DNA-binding NtrC family response regulator
MTQPKKILVVGYDPSLLTTRKMVLQSGRYEVVSVDSDHQAMKLLADNGFDLVVLGTSVPPIGFEQLEKRIRDAYPKTFIVKIQPEWAEQAKSISSFVGEGLPFELMEAIRLLFHPGKGKAS